MAHARTKLQQLFIREQRVEIPTGEVDEDGNEEVLVFYARKMNPLQQENARRAADAARVHMQRIADRPDDPDYDVMEAAVDEISDLSMFIAEVEIARDKEKMEQELSEEEEWAQDNYYQSLIDAWTDDMRRDFAENLDEDRKPETKKIWAEMKRFNDILQDKIKRRRTNRAAEVEDWPLEKQRYEVLKILLEQQASQEWLRVFNTHRLMYGIVDEDKNRIFESEEDVWSTPAEAQRIFRQAIEEVTLPVTEVKS